MNAKNEKYSKYALCREMLDTVDVVRKFDPSRTAAVAAAIKANGRLMLTGEGSSRIFPAKNFIRKVLTAGLNLQVVTEGSRQAMTYDLSRFAVFAASNSGRTKEVVKLLKQLRDGGNKELFGLTAQPENLLKEYARETIVLNCGWETAVAATKSVIEQALTYQSMLGHMTGSNACTCDCKNRLADAIEQALTIEIPADIVAAAAKAPTIYFAGYNDGVAEELTLKTNEITRKKSDFLEGTYACHGIEEVMSPADIVFVVDPIAEEMDKFREVLVDGVGLKVVCIATSPIAGFPTIVVPESGEGTPHVFLAAGWNILVEIGLALGINLDKPQRKADFHQNIP
ncbi:MAG TPA: SIS domain-containing protein, partial [Phycisphaerae bacterium]|nr:SIS domain-containing protein [Phycisphaerae bacterium]